MSTGDRIRELSRLHPLLRSADDDAAHDAVAEFEDEVVAPTRELAKFLADMGTDFVVTDLDGMTAILAITDEAEAWFEKRVAYEDSQVLPGIGVAMETHAAADLIEVIRTETPFTVGGGAGT